MTEHLFKVFKLSREVRDFIYDKISKEYTNLPCWVNERMFYQEMFDACLPELIQALEDGEDDVTFFKLSTALCSKTFQTWKDKAFFDELYVKYNFTIPDNIVSVYCDNTSNSKEITAVYLKENYNFTFTSGDIDFYYEALSTKRHSMKDLIENGHEDLALHYYNQEIKQFNSPEVTMDSEEWKDEKARIVVNDYRR